MKKLRVILIAASIFAASLTTYFVLEKQSQQRKEIVLNTLYGDFKVTEPILIDLLNSKAVLRMKKLKQFGILHYAKDFGVYNRYIHSVGVFVLIRKYGASLEEQIAGLLHDVSHTAFSHLADSLFVDKVTENNSYQDNIHKWFLEQTDIPQIAAKYGYTIDDFLHKQDGFKCLEQKLPDLCADRLEYILYENALNIGNPNSAENKKFAKYILDNLHFENGTWYFDTPDAAYAYAKLTLDIPRESWMSNWAAYLDHKASGMVKRAVELKLIDQEIIHFGTDKKVWEKLENSNDPEIKAVMNIIYNYSDYCHAGTEDNYDLHFKRKFKGVNPYVKTKNGLKRLTEIDKDFANYYDHVRKEVGKGAYIKDMHK